MNKILIVLIAILTSVGARAQYTVAGKIEFERKVNIHAQMAELDAEENQWFEKMKSQIPKFNTSYFDMMFDTTRSIYKPGREVEGNNIVKICYQYLKSLPEYLGSEDI